MFLLIIYCLDWKKKISSKLEESELPVDGKPVESVVLLSPDSSDDEV